MKKMRGKLWVKFIAVVLAIVTGLGTLFCFAATVLFGLTPALQQSQENIERMIDERLLENYGAALLMNLNLADGDNIKGLDALDGGGIHYTVLKREMVPVETGAEEPKDEEETSDIVTEEPDEETLMETDAEEQYEVVETVLYTNDKTVDEDNCVLFMHYAAGEYLTYYGGNSFLGMLGRMTYDNGFFYESATGTYWFDSTKTDSISPYYVVCLSAGEPMEGHQLNNGMTDYTYEAGQLAAWLCNFRGTSGFGLAGFAILFVLCFAFLMGAAGRRADGEVHLRWLDKIPFLIPLVLVCAEVPSACLLIYEFMQRWLGWGSMGAGLAVGGSVALAAATIALVIWFCMSVAVRVKTKSFWRYTLLHCIMRPLGWLWRMIRDNVPLFAKGLILLAAVSAVELVVLAAGVSSYNYGDMLFLFFVLYKLVEIPLFIHVLYQMNLLKKGGMRVAAGDYGEPIDTRHMIWEFKKHGENINQVGTGIAIAVEERMKSERFKTELITNVSHDIKTPLTSIINYVDLMKKEDITDPILKEYVAVLERQSARLKKLIEDLMEASKASTGNLPVNLEKCDATVMLTQMVGEFEERAKENNLELVVTAPEPPVYIMADGRHLWRIVDNLMGNACKYAMPGTRVYVDLEVFHGMVILTFRNISKSRLNIASDELMERFVRGDSSRNTEGSGLGLSIAQSLTALMDGNMAIQIDGDLFKAIVSFEELR